ncbi:MAG: hypothetical protein GY859_30355, partial [Desulfobacterales bacterium]|nr:hypothetical protein [Desulfobacterales bacterium]
MKNDSTMLLSLYFEDVRVRISGENGIVYTCRISKKDISMGEAARDGKDVASAWRIDPAPRDMETPVWPHLHLPASREYTPRHKRARPVPREGRPPANRIDYMLYALWKDYFLDASARYDRALRRGAVDALKAVFSKHERKKGARLKASPPSAYMRVSSYLEKSGVDEGIVPFATFKKDLENEAGMERIVTCIAETDEKLDKFTGELEVLQDAANRMLDAGRKIIVDMDGPRIESKNNDP